MVLQLHVINSIIESPLLWCRESNFFALKILYSEQNEEPPSIFLKF